MSVTQFSFFITYDQTSESNYFNITKAKKKSKFNSRRETLINEKRTYPNI